MCKFTFKFTIYLAKPLSDKENEWVKKAAQGDPHAFTQLFETYHQRLGAYVYRLTGSMALAEDIVQDVFLQIWTHRESLAEVTHFGAYLYVLSRNRAYNCLRQLARERVRHAKAMQDLLRLDGADERETYFRLLEHAVAALPPQQRKAYLLSRRDRLKQGDIARMMGLSHETVKKYLKLANRSIFKYVEARRSVLSSWWLIGLIAGTGAIFFWLR